VQISDQAAYLNVINLADDHRVTLLGN